MAVKNLRQLEQRLQHRFERAELLTLALTHSSKGARNNQRLEYLGDACLGLVFANWLYARQGHAGAGELTRLRAYLVCKSTLVQAAKYMQLAAYVQVNTASFRGQSQLPGGVLADVVEALIAAVYLDAGLQACTAVVLHWWQQFLPPGWDQDLLKDAKTSLQEYAQARGYTLPQYRCLSQEHSAECEVQVMIAEQPEVFSARAGSQREAQMAAAQAYLQYLRAQGKEG